MNAAWQRKILGDVCVVEKSQGRHNHLPYVGLENIESHTGRFVGSTQARGVKSSTFKFSPEHLLYARLRPYLNKVMAPDFCGHCSTEIFPIKPSAALLRRFLQYWFLSEETVSKIDATSTGARMPRANMNAVLDFEFLLPPLSEQRRIVGILDGAFDGIATAESNAGSNLRNARVLFERQLEFVFTDRGRGWTEELIGSVCEIKHGFAFDGANFSNDTPNGNPYIITPGNFTEEGKLLFNERNTKRFSGNPPAGFLFDVGDLVVVMTDLSSKMKILGKPAFVQTDDVLHNQRIGRVVFLNDRIQKRFLYYFMMSETFLKNIKGSATGTMVKHTAPKRILSNVIPFPSNRNEQFAVIAKFDALHEETQRLESIYRQKLVVLKRLKKSLLNRAFTGAL